MLFVVIVLNPFYIGYYCISNVHYGKLNKYLQIKYKKLYIYFENVCTSIIKDYIHPLLLNTYMFYSDNIKSENNTNSTW